MLKGWKIILRSFSSVSSPDWASTDNIVAQIVWFDTIQSESTKLWNNDKMLKTKTENRLFYFYISGTFGHLWSVRPDDRLDLVSHVQHRLQLPDAEHQQLPHRCDHAAGSQTPVREADKQLPPASLRGLRYRVPAVHPALLPHHPHHPQDVLQSLGDFWKLSREITGIESAAGQAGQVSDWELRGLSWSAQSEENDWVLLIEIYFWWIWTTDNWLLLWIQIMWYRPNSRIMKLKRKMVADTLILHLHYCDKSQLRFCWTPLLNDTNWRII